MKPHSMDFATFLGYLFAVMQKIETGNRGQTLVPLRLYVVLSLAAAVPLSSALADGFIPRPVSKPQILAAKSSDTASPQTPMPATKPGFEESSGTRPILSSHKEMPTPAPKPDFGKPSTAQLLSYGATPIPAPKPIGHPASPLTDKDAQLYRQIFAAQHIADWDKADNLSARLSDLRLRGHILFQRYMHPTAYKTSFEELRGWLDLYADHPDAGRIYRLALARMPSDYNGSLQKPVLAHTALGFLKIFTEQSKDYVSAARRNPSDHTAIAELTKKINRALARNAPGRAMDILQESTAAIQLDNTETDILKAKIANGFMMAGKITQARNISMSAAERSGSQAPQAAWVAGLIAWQEGRYEQAAPLFERMAGSAYASSWGKAAGAYWASRSHARLGNVRMTKQWLENAAENTRTFYGIIATRALGRDITFNWHVPELTAEHIATIRDNPAGQRAMALVDAGQYYLAEKELRRIQPENNDELYSALLAFTNQMALPSLSMRLAQAITRPEGGLYDASLYPLSPWEPKNGYRIDRALIYALIRQESRFNPFAENGSGATGLMQIMPGTANFVSGKTHYNSKDGRHNLKDPEVNLDIGQRYIENLLSQDSVNEDLFSLAIAYNAGPGNLRKWKRQLADMKDDPLLFVETIPMSETRAFVERVMANYWIYRARLGQPSPSLDNVIKGHWPQYVGLDTVKHATAASKIIPPAKPYRLADGRSYQ